METEVTVIRTKEQLQKDMEHYFHDFEAKAREWAAKAESIEVTDESQTELMAEAKKARLALRAVRINVDNLHKELKAESLLTGQVLDSIKRKLVGLIEPIEAKLEMQEKFAEVKEAERKEKLFKERFAILQPFMGEEAKKIALAELDESVFTTMVKGYEAKAEIDRLNRESFAKETALKEKEQKEIRDENDRLRKLQEITEKRINQIITLGFTYSSHDHSYVFSGDGKHVLNISMVELKTLNGPEWDTMIEAMSPMIQEYLDVKKREVEAKEAERIAAENKLKADQAEVKKQRDIADQRARDEEAERKRKEAEQRKLKRAPDKDKLLLLVEQTCFPKDPGLKDDEAVKLFSEFERRIKAVGGWMSDKAREL